MGWDVASPQVLELSLVHVLLARIAKLGVVAQSRSLEKEKHR